MDYTGRSWERRAERFLREQGLTTITRNFSAKCGEIDLVMQAADGAIVHLELAVKFYLGRADLHNPQQHCSDPQHWWGIDTRDTLAHKLARLTQHQLPLSQRLPELATAHRALPLPEVAAAWLQGGLFTPLDQPMPLPAGGWSPQTICFPSLMQ